MRHLSKSKEEYIANHGWSSHHFFEHATYAFKFFESLGYHFEVGRHVMYLMDSKDGVLLKFYVHYKGRDRKHMTMTNENGVALLTVTSDISPERLCEKVLHEIIG